MLYRLELAEARKSENGGGEDGIKKTNSELAKQMRILAEISRNKNIPVVITSQVYSAFLSKEEFAAGKEREVSMVGGDIPKYWSKCIIELKNTGGRRKAVIRKHRSLPEKEMSFIITNSGIKKRGFF